MAATRRAPRALRALRAVTGGVGAILMLLVALAAGVGWLYALRGLHLFAFGPRVGDSLPLLQLAGFDAQPVARLVVAWLLAGAIFGVALIRVRALPRTIFAGMLAVLLLLFASQASFALARNLRLTHVLWSRSPGFGPWLEGLLFAVGSALPRPVARPQWLASPAFLRGGGVDTRHLLLRASQHRDASEHDRDGEQVPDRRSRGPA